MENFFLECFAVFVDSLSSLTNICMSRHTDSIPNPQKCADLFSLRKVHLLCNCAQPPQDYSNLASAFLTFLPQSLQLRSILPHKLVIKINQIVRSLGSFAMLVHRFQ